MIRTFRAARGWQRDGTALLLAAMSRLTEEECGEPSGLPGWTRAHLLAHVAGNADALLNLITWARTGVATPMYASPEAREDAIRAGSQLPFDRLALRVDSSALALEAAMEALTEDQWTRSVVTAQGRTVPATETAWMRAREVMVHAVDLDNGLTFADLPEDFLRALQEDIKERRGVVPQVRGAEADVTAWLAGRPYGRVTLAGGSVAAPLGPWL